MITLYYEDIEDFLLAEIEEALYSSSVLEKKAALSLLGNILSLVKDNFTTEADFFACYLDVFSSLFIIKQDENTDVSVLADGVFKNFVENSPKCLRIIFSGILNKLSYLCVVDEEYSQYIFDVASRAIASKYGESLFVIFVESCN
jgi:hypothetical protein